MSFTRLEMCGHGFMSRVRSDVVSVGAPCFPPCHEKERQLPF